MINTPAIPAELLDQLKAANDRFSRSRREVERWMDASEYRHQERVARAEDQLHKAEREILNIEERIRKLLAAARQEDTVH